MTLMVLGLFLWVGVHLFPVLAPALRLQLIGRIGNLAYQGLFALLILLGLILIVLGWQGSTPTILYMPPMGLRHPAMLLVVIALILFAVSYLPSRIRRFIRHPQLTGVLVWALAHLMANGDSRSVLLFGVMGAWALLSMFAINQRDGAWSRPEAPALWREAIPVVVGLVVAVILVRLHPYLSGVSLMG